MNSGSEREMLIFKVLGPLITTTSNCDLEARKHNKNYKIYQIEILFNKTFAINRINL